jgi:osmotically-inducible protein OsmY
VDESGQPSTKEPAVLKSNDDVLREEVLKQLGRDRRVEGPVEVDVEDAVVRLGGTVPSDLGRALALYDALIVEGVTRVINNLTVSEATAPTRYERH